MCGIVGLMTRDGSAPDDLVVSALADAVRHRGPDGEGRYSSRNFAMAQTRLAIIDLETGDQPLYEAGGAALVANGEIYNYIELRTELGGASFSTASDCEAPLHLYRRHGLDFVDHLRGMYSIALYDPVEGQLVLARDPFGIKPLYYSETEAGFCFASEPQALLEAGLVDRAINPTARAELLQLQYTTGADTVFQNIQRVLPGETLVVRDGRIVARRRKPALPQTAPADWDMATALELLDEALHDSVEIHQRADVPYGMFLSGGVDSSVLLALMAELNEQPVRTFTAGFDDPSVPDERDHARRIAHAVGAETVDVGISQNDLWQRLPEIAAAVDDPAADYAILPTYLLGEAVRKSGLKVVLTGEGGDELFAGYGRYRSVVRPWWQGGRSMRARGMLDGLDVLREIPVGWRDGISAAEEMLISGPMSRLQIAQAADCADWLPNDLLTKVDRCLMAHGVEGRTPFLDPRVAAVAFRLSDQLKVKDGLGKWLLRRWLDARLPISGAFERKRGFSVPVAEWIFARGAEIGPLVARQPGIAEICEPKKVENLYLRRGKRQGFAAWLLLFYALWHNHHIVGNSGVGGDVFDVLDDARRAA
ncbi:MAG: asparagine synthase (glutamine-hydrolyzing) [Alphaproteobacteria bacterium]|nr:asparagine synthase (glutamine-hydrolyzing) [Alphaproteobacteria bacterium]